MLDQIPKSLRGRYLFPIEPGTKEPALRNGWHGASNDPAQIAEWLKFKPNYNWALATGMSGLLVYDIDPEGLEWWHDLVANNAEVRQAVENALVVRTPRDGLHIYFEGEGASSASRIIKGVDTRGGFKLADGSVQSGGYVLLPGSRTVYNPAKKTVDGVYEVLSGSDPVPLPSLLFDLIPERKKNEVKSQNLDISLDSDRNVARVREVLERYVADGKVSVEGAGGNDTAFRVACSVLEKGLSVAKGLELMLEHWNNHCSPPWADWELERVLINASSYGDDTAQGAKALPTNQEAFAAFAEMMERTQPEKPKATRRVQWLHDFADNAPEPTWLIPNMLPSQGVGMLYGDTGSYKTFVALDFALSLAYGVSGQWGAPPVKNDVVFLAGEAAAAVAKKRWPAWLEWRGLEDRVGHRFLILPEVPLFAKQDDWAQLRDDLAVLEVKPALIVIDTLAKMMVGMDENSSKEAGQVWQFMEELAAHYDCLVLFLHHTGKDHSRGARGASLFSQNAACSLALKRRNEGTELYVKKLKDAEFNPDKGTYLKLKEVGPSIVLEKSDSPAGDEAPKRGSRYPWADTSEIVSRINASGGTISHSLLAMEIAGDFAVDIAMVKKILGSEQALQFLRKDANTWSIPSQENDYDL